MSTAPALDIFGEDICKRPVEFANRLRAQAPIFLDPNMGVWVILNHEDVKQLLVHEDLHISPKYSANYSSAEHAAKYPAWYKMREFNPFSDDVKHPLIRKMTVKAFSPSALRRIEHQIKHAVDTLVKPLIGVPGVVDVAKEISPHLPYRVLCALFGVDRLREDSEAFLEHCRVYARLIDPLLTDDEKAVIEKSAAYLAKEVAEMIVQSRKHPGEDLISDFVRAADEMGGLNDDDLACAIIALISTGSTATVFTLTLVVHALLTQHEQRAYLMAHPEMIDQAVEELVRFAHGGKFAYRFAMRDLEYRGFQIKKGQVLMMSFAGISNDPKVFDHPEQCEFARNNKAALSFGHGVHYCVGAHVARNEIRFLVKAFLDYAPKARVLTDKIEWNLMNIINREISTLLVDTGN